MSEPTTVFGVGERDRGKRLDRFLHERIPSVSRAYVQRAIRSRVTLSWGVIARPACPVRPGGEVRIGWTPVAEVPLEVSIPVLGRGDGWIAVDKPGGIPVHPVNRARENTVIRIVRRQERRDSLTLVHRLDRETSGVLLLADGPEIARCLSRAFEAGRVRKEYLALVRGAIEGEVGRIDLPIADARGSRVFVRREAGADGRPCRTDWAVERRFADRTLVRVVPRTGRRHQIRVHFAAIGHAILGDILYGRSDRDYLDLVAGRGDVRRTEGGPRRHLLHAARLVFPDPARPEGVEVVSDLPDDFRAALAAGASGSG